MKGSCKYGPACHFAHGDIDLRQPVCIYYLYWLFPFEKVDIWFNLMKGLYIVTIAKLSNLNAINVTQDNFILTTIHFIPNLIVKSYRSYYRLKTKSCNWTMDSF